MNRPTATVLVLVGALLAGCGSNTSSSDGFAADGASGPGSSSGGSDGATGSHDAGVLPDATTAVDSAAAGDASGGGQDATSGVDALAPGDGGGADVTAADAADGSVFVLPDSGTPLVTQCDGSTTALTGVVLAPNGTDPIPKVRVYAAAAINPYPRDFCDKCVTPLDPAYVAALSAADGSFTLSLDTLPSGTTSIEFTIQIGRFRKHTTLPVTACQTTAVPAAPRTLPGTSSAGDIPHIAVSSGNTDHLDAVLSSLGITEYDCYEGRKTAGASTATCAQVAGKTIADVLSDSTALGAYHMLFLSCAPGAYASFITQHTQATMTANTTSWVAGGGRVLATDTAYDYLAQAFPAAITFAGPTGSPQPVDGANVGCAPPGSGGTSAHAVSYPTTIDDPDLEKWLQVVGFPAGPVNIQGYYQPWSVMASLAPTTSRWADSTMPVDPTYPTTTCGSPAMQDVSVTAEFDVPSCGRAAFSSFHTYTGTGASAQSANEKIMEYFVFGIDTCLE